MPVAALKRTAQDGNAAHRQEIITAPKLPSPYACATKQTRTRFHGSLISAIRSQNLTEVTKLLQEDGVSVHCRFGAPINEAIKTGNKLIFNKLIECGAHVETSHIEAIIKQSRSALSRAILTPKNLARFKELSEKERKVLYLEGVKNGHHGLVNYFNKVCNQMWAESHDALFIASANNQLAMVKHFSKKNSTRSMDPAQNHALIIAAEKGHLNIVKFLVSQGATTRFLHRSDPPERKLHTPVQAAAKFGHVEVLKFLLSKNFSIHDDNGRALHYAAENGHLEAVKCLDYKRFNTYDVIRTFVSAAQAGHIEVVKHLWPGMKGFRGYLRDALESVVKQGHLEVYKFLDENGIASENKDDDFTKAAQYGQLELVKYFSKKVSSNPELFTQAFYSAAQEDRIEVVKFLVAQGADIHCWNDQVFRSFMRQTNNTTEFLWLHVALTETPQSFERCVVCQSWGDLERHWESAQTIANKFPLISIPMLALVLYHCHKADSIIYPDQRYATSIDSHFMARALAELNKICKENTTSKKQKEAILALFESLEGFEQIRDMLEEISAALFVAIEQEDSSKLDDKKYWDAIREQAAKDAVELLVCEEAGHLRTLSELARWNRLWHRSDQRLPSDCRPVLAMKEWDRLFDNYQMGSYTICNLCSQDDLVSEAKQLDHCLGNGSYAQAGEDGTSQIVSIQNGSSLATIELIKNGSGVITDKSGAKWKVKQIRGWKNEDASSKVHSKWGEFVDCCNDRKVTLYAPKKKAVILGKDIPEVCKITGIYPDESCFDIVQHYSGMHLRTENGRRLPLILPNTLAYELARSIIA